MEVPIIQIGNSKGLRLSKSILERYAITEKVELIFEKGYLIIKPIETPRQGWEDAFKEMHENEDDQLLIGNVFPEEEAEEWR